MYVRKIVLTNKMIEMMNVFEHELSFSFMRMALLKNKINLVFVGSIKIVFVQGLENWNHIKIPFYGNVNVYMLKGIIKSH